MTMQAIKLNPIEAELRRVNIALEKGICPGCEKNPKSSRMDSLCPKCYDELRDGLSGNTIA